MSKATLHTNHGDIVIDFFEEQAPQTVANFVGLAGGTKQYRGADGVLTTGRYYDGVIFHRIIAGFMLQGGDPTGTGAGGPGYEFDNETHPDLRFDRPYLVAMANRGPDTNGSQFFITVNRTPHLNGGYSIFGEVTDPASREVVDEIAQVPTDGRDRPLTEVVIESVDLA